MNNWTFKPEKSAADSLKAPWYEDARADTAPYYSSTITIQKAMARVTEELGKLQAGVLEFQRGVFEVNKQQRHGYLIRFTQGGAIGVIRIAGLPIYNHTPIKETRVRVQALLIVRDWLKSAVTAQIFNPDMQPLLPFLLMADGRTVAEMITSGQFALPVPTVEVTQAGDA